MAFRGVQTFYSAVIARLNMLDVADRDQRYSAISLYKTIYVYTSLYKPINRDITYDRNIELRFDAKRLIETFEVLKKSLVRGISANVENCLVMLIVKLLQEVDMATLRTSWLNEPCRLRFWKTLVGCV